LKRRCVRLDGSVPCLLRSIGRGNCRLRRFLVGAVADASLQGFDAAVREISFERRKGMLQLMWLVFLSVEIISEMAVTILDFGTMEETAEMMQRHISPLLEFTLQTCTQESELAVMVVDVWSNFVELQTLVEMKQIHDFLPRFVPL
jgi:hypothetical protein